jgi:hypothetical protein
MTRWVVAFAICCSFAACADGDGGPGSERALRDARWREDIAESLATPAALRTPQPWLCANMRLIAEGEDPTAPDPVTGFVLTSDGDWPSDDVAEEFVSQLCE